MTAGRPTQLERIAVLEEKATSIDARTERTESKVDLLVEWMTQEKARKRGIMDVFGVGRAVALVSFPFLSLVLSILVAIGAVRP